MSEISANLSRPLPPVLSRLLSGTFWLALRTPLQALLAFWSVPLMLGAFGKAEYSAFGFAWGFGFLQFLLEFGMSSALQREVSERWTRGDRAGVDRTLTCGMVFYAVVSLIQALTLLVVAYVGLPESNFSSGPAYQLIIKLLWLQAITAPCYGASVLVSSVLQASRRYGVIPRFELLIVVLRFVVLWVGIRFDADLLTIIILQTVVQVALGLGPALWVMIYDLAYLPRLTTISWRDFRGLTEISLAMFMIQLSVVIADKMDKAVLGFALADPEQAIAAYDVVSKPFLQLRQMGWMLAYFVLPAVASLTAADDRKGLDRVKYDGPRLHSAAVLPVGLLATIYGGPFLELWIGDQFPGQVPELAGLLRLFMIAALPLFVAVQVQMATGLGKVNFVAIAALVGAIINLPLSYLLTVRIGISGVIWGTVLTTLFSNLIAPGAYTFRVLGVSIPIFLRRTLLAPLLGSITLLVTAGGLHSLGFRASPEGVDGLWRTVPLLIHLSIGVIAFVGGYLIAPAGRQDLQLVVERIRQRIQRATPS